jgi:hypothetical protein
MAEDLVMSAANIADRITAGLCVSPADACLKLMMVAVESTEQGITAASSMLLEAWADEVLSVAESTQGGESLYWVSVAAALQSMAWEKSTGPRGKEVQQQCVEVA